MTENNTADNLPSCPICGAPLDETHRVEGGWDCGGCGEFVPKGLERPPRIDEAPPCHGRGDITPRRDSGD